MMTTSVGGLCAGPSTPRARNRFQSRLGVALSTSELVRFASSIRSVRGRCNLLRVERLGPDDVDRARETFTLLAAVFDETNEVVPDAYISALLLRPEFWAIAAVRNDTVIGGLTAHTLMMTNSPRSGAFIYDIAVDARRQREGVGRRLVEVLREQTRAAGIDTVFVPADNDDAHALDFYRSIGATGSAVTIFGFDSTQHPTEPVR